ncbi:tyrosine-protein phosphatase [Acidovorax sp. GBBC 3334]|uniref:tyrosine-protein phosphatase n=1 Tax=Acidovorax sp. GBBC 3334 TaxID=2940496 RepID=UPI00230432AC|nr:tyrosine-protein phosphatase [Acidovorax sp. GBBC 3334]MDA8456034.1 tyrosine-protein phosphatase [Acidovorax sp. GBBC 3334]
MDDATYTRSLNLSGATNFRDLGGYAGQDGRRVRWRRIYRSDHLAGLTAEDARAIAVLGLRRAVDFRGAHERATLPYELPGVAYRALSIEPTVVQRAKEMALSGHEMTAAIAAELMRDTYRAFVANNAPEFAALFAHLLESDVPLVFHCTAGKDRTGFAAAMILLTLGVPRDVVMQDYLLTNGLYQRPAQLHGSAPDEVLNVLWRVQEDFLEAALQAVESDHGGVDRYLEQRLGVGAAERERLAQLYLQPHG